MTRVFKFIAGAGFVVAVIACLCLHLLTVVVWWNFNPIAGVFAFTAPVLAEIALLIHSANVNPRGWANNYTAYFVITVGLVFGAGILASIAAAMESRES